MQYQHAVCVVAGAWIVPISQMEQTAQGGEGHREWVEELASKRGKRKAKVCHPEPHFLLSLGRRISGGRLGWKRMLGLAGHGCLLQLCLSLPCVPGTCPTKGGRRNGGPRLGALERELQPVCWAPDPALSQTSISSLSRGQRGWRKDRHKG